MDFIEIVLITLIGSAALSLAVKVGHCIYTRSRHEEYEDLSSDDEKF